MNSSELDRNLDVSSEQNESELFSAILRRIGHGKWQWIIFAITTYSGIALAMGNLGAAFIAGVPDYWCSIPGSDGSNVSTLTVTQPLPKCYYYIVNETIMAEHPHSTNSEFGITPAVEKVQCTEWEYDDYVFSNTIVTEWDLVCNDKRKTATAQSIYMLGVLVGGLFLSEISDIYGRRRTILISTVFSTVSTFVVVFSRDYVSFVALRFISAIFVTGVFLPAFVLMMELVDSKSRSFMGMLFQIPFSIGVVILPALSYFIKSWRYLQATIGLFTAVMMINFWLIPESPRWLIWKGQNEEAFKILNRGARMNKNNVYDEEILEKMVMNINPAHHMHSNKTIKEHIQIFFTTTFKLVKTPIIRRRTIIMCYQWYVVSTVYYGLTLASSSFKISPHAMLSIGGTADIIGLLFATFLVSKMGRRSMLSMAYVICGLACVTLLFIPIDYKVVVLSIVTLGKLANAIAFSVIFLFSAELMPTPIRNVALGTTAIFTRIGGASVPYILDKFEDVNPIIPPALFGILSLLAGGLTLLLPESANKPLPETIEEVERMKR